ncbi:hypothetical protein BDY17DRAFT_310649 [Neohortaea acidophila]|uniref:CipC-like antibiotic response protein n=1 Tax=Neohortaea acidophila TaxID=245834 RepID=A0A6A6PUC7_9PEZI|nr:uncharacterized protein BDY17DRAFT_310649 [Neohortaea acidophila]KAF2483690.1 hypothetical protein BDY17DRAFT_310649 [Neohortaea acidophila]
MWGFDDAQQQYNQCQDPNQASLGHEVLAGGASFIAMREWEEHQRKEGKQVDHSFAKEMIAGFAGAEVDRLAETKGADFVDREEARRQARDNAHQLYDQQYGQDQYYDPNQRQPHERIQESFESRNGNW